MCCLFFVFTKKLLNPGFFWGGFLKQIQEEVFFFGTASEFPVATVGGPSIAVGIPRLSRCESLLIPSECLWPLSFVGPSGRFGSRFSFVVAEGSRQRGIS